MKDTVKEVIITSKNQLVVAEQELKKRGYTYKLMCCKYNLSNEETIEFPLVLRVDMESKKISSSSVPFGKNPLGLREFLLNYIVEKDLVIMLHLSSIL